MLKHFTEKNLRRPYEFVEGFNITCGGSGYVTTPAVTITGGGGSGALAQSTISGGVVNGISIMSPGSGYTGTPTVTIAAPPANISYTTYWSNDGTSSVGSEPAAALAVNVTNGLFVVVLGDTTVANMTAISASQFTQPNLQLRIWFNDGVNGFAALSPLQNLTPAPYAAFANIASNLNGTLPATQLTGTIPASQLSGTVGSATSFSGNLSGDVTGTQSATVVSSVGGQTAAQLASAAISANAATSANVPGAIVQRDSGGTFQAGNVNLSGWLALPATTSASGIIYCDSSPFIHSYGSLNFFAGRGAGNFTLTGNDNVGIGFAALNAVSSGNANVAVGYGALQANSTGPYNVALGFNALGSLGSGQANIALGLGAGQSITAGDNNIFIGNNGSDGDSGVIRIGTAGTHLSTSIAGIYNHAAASGVQVYVVSSGQLGTLPSSAKFKHDIQSMGDASDVLLALKPVTFQYKPEIDPKGIPQFGLVAEDVEKVNPDLVVHDAEHGIYTVRYQAVDAMLLNEFLKEHRKVEAQDAVIQDLQQSVADLKKMVQSLAEKK